MPKNTVSSGPTNVDALPGEVGYMPELHEEPLPDEPEDEENLVPEEDDEDTDGQETVTLNLS